MGVDRLAAARRGAPPCPVPPRTTGGLLGCGAPLCFRPTPAPSCRRGTPSSLPCLLCPSALRPARARCGAIRVAAPPLCPLSLPWTLGPVLPPVCSPSLVLTCPPSQVPWSLALGVSVPVLPLPSRHTLRGAIREAPRRPRGASRLSMAAMPTFGTCCSTSVVTWPRISVGQRRSMPLVSAGWGWPLHMESWHALPAYPPPPQGPARPHPAGPCD